MAVGDDDGPAELCSHGCERFGVFACAEDNEALWRSKAFRKRYCPVLAVIRTLSRRRARRR